MTRKYNGVLYRRRSKPPVSPPALQKKAAPRCARKPASQARFVGDKLAALTVQLQGEPLIQVTEAGNVVRLLLPDQHAIVKACDYYEDYRRAFTVPPMRVRFPKSRRFVSAFSGTKAVWHCDSEQTFKDHIEACRVEEKRRRDLAGMTMIVPSFLWGKEV
jgi:hypothetical protein